MPTNNTTINAITLSRRGREEEEIQMTSSAENVKGQGPSCAQERRVFQII